MKDQSQTQSKAQVPQLIDIIPASHLNSLVSRVFDYIESSPKCTTNDGYRDDHYLLGDRL
jgi:hypothetical protein